MKTLLSSFFLAIVLSTAGGLPIANAAYHPIQELMGLNTTYSSISGNGRTLSVFADAGGDQFFVQYYGTHISVLNYDDSFYSPSHGFSFRILPSSLGSRCVLLTWPGGQDDLCRPNASIRSWMQTGRLYVTTSGNGRSLKLIESPAGLQVIYYGTYVLSVDESGNFYSPQHAFTFTISRTTYPACVNLRWPEGSDVLCMQ